MAENGNSVKTFDTVKTVAVLVSILAAVLYIGKKDEQLSQTVRSVGELTRTVSLLVVKTELTDKDVEHLKERAKELEDVTERLDDKTVSPRR